jgi:hypothetical protein
VTVTRTELANHIESAFTHGPVSRDNLLAYAVSSHARPEIIAIIARLPDRTYPGLRDLWLHLVDVPIGQ